MKVSRKAKRYDDAVIPGDFRDFELFTEGDLNLEGEAHGAIRRREGGLELGHLSLERPSARKQSFAKLRTKAELLRLAVTYLGEQLEIVDHDRRGMYIQLRSLPPYKDELQIQFNEINIAKDRVVVKRIAFYRRDEVKQQVALNLTEGSLARLLCDLREVLKPA